MKKITFTTQRVCNLPMAKTLQVISIWKAQIPISFYWEFERPYEMNEFLDQSQPNMDYPDNLQFHEMGLNQLKNPHLDLKAPVSKTSTWDARGLNSDFRDRCVQYNGSNWFLELKSKRFFEPPAHLDIFKIVQRLEIGFDLAEKLVNAIGDLQLCQHDAELIISDLEKWDLEHIEKTAEYLDTLAGALEDVTVSRREFQPYDDNICNSLNIGTWDPDYDPDTEDEDFDYSGDNNPFTAHKLYWGKEALPDEFIRMVLESDIYQLAEVKRGFSPQLNEYTGKLYKPKYRFMSYTQRQQAWEYIRIREDQLAAAAKKNMSKSCKEALELILQFGKCSESLAIIKRAATGGVYDMFGVKIPFEKITPQEQQILWATYRQQA